VRRRGYLALVLHAHLPFVRHPEHAHQLEEHWLFQAITESYLPLLSVLREAAQRGSGFRLTLSLSPTLMAMLSDPLLRARYRQYLERLEALCEAEMDRRAGDPVRLHLACWYHRRLLRLRDLYLDGLRGDLIAAWSQLADAGLVELMTTAATHGYLPLLRSAPAAVRAQLRVALDYVEGVLGRAPAGLWLPECGYFPGLEREVRDAGFRWFVLDAHGLQGARPAPDLGVFAPVSASQMAVFGRDPESAREIWDRRQGYPGHPLYREYYRDLGFEADADSLRAFFPPGVTAAPTGIKYHRVTGATEHKAYYQPQAALAQADQDAARFLERRRKRVERLDGAARPPLLVAPFDAELFGHWWFEGPAFLDALIRRMDAGEGPQPVTLGGYLRREGTAGQAEPAASSWGEHGYNGAWLRPATGWVHLRLHQAAEELTSLVRRYDPPTGDEGVGRLLRQAARSLLLAQSSDWTFHLERGGAADYAQARLRDLLARFRFLADALRSRQVEERRLSALERMDNLFPALDLSHFA